MAEEQVTQQWNIPRPGVSSNDPLLKCLTLLTRFFNHPFSEETLAAGLPLVNGCLTPELFSRAAERAGLKSKLMHRPLDKISPLTLPVILLLKDGRWSRKARCHRLSCWPRSARPTI